MKRKAATHRATAAIHFCGGYVFVLSLVLAAASQLARAQQSGTAAVSPVKQLTAEQVVENLVQMNHQRLAALQAYQGNRTYRVEYRGFPGNRNAEMVVEVKYQSPDTKEFTINSATGSKVIIDKVFKKLLEAEKEALTAEMQARTILNESNYAFTMAGLEATPAGTLYVLAVEPRTKDKFLYRGRIWVDAHDFAVVRLEGEPAKNPSFWTKKAEIVQVYSKVGDFWLPASNHSVTAIRLGGRAELTIQYHDYRITKAGPVAGLSRPELTRSAEGLGWERLSARQ